jgi:hypothetical protein
LVTTSEGTCTIAITAITTTLCKRKKIRTKSHCCNNNKSEYNKSTKMETLDFTANCKTKKNYTKEA